MIPLSGTKRSTLERMVAGALKDAINSHGAITKDNISSAAKRVIGVIKAFNKITLEQARIAQRKAKQEYPDIFFDIFLMNDRYILLASKPIDRETIMGIEVL